MLRSPLRLASLALLLLAAACSGKGGAATEDAGEAPAASSADAGEPTTSGGGEIGEPGPLGSPGGSGGPEEDGGGMPGAGGTPGAGTPGGGTPGGATDGGATDSGVKPADGGGAGTVDAGGNPLCTGGAIPEVEPNDTRAQATPLPPGSLCGKVGGTDVDILVIKLEAGKRYDWRYTSDRTIRVTSQQVGDDVFLEVRPGNNGAANYRVVLDVK